MFVRDSRIRSVASETIASVPLSTMPLTSVSQNLEVNLATHTDVRIISYLSIKVNHSNINPGVILGYEKIEIKGFEKIKVGLVIVVPL